MARVTVTMADRGTAIMAAMPLITADTPRRTTTATFPHTADIDRLTMLPPIMVTGTGERRLSPLQIGLKPHQVRPAKHDGRRRQHLECAIRHPKELSGSSSRQESGYIECETTKPLTP